MSDIDRTEIILPIPGFPGYEVSSLGRVFSTKNRGPQNAVENGRRVLRFRPYNEFGYHGVTVYVEGKCYKKSVAYLVALTFHGPRPDGLEIRHLDGNPTNNRPENLRYGTVAENIQDKVRHGRISRGIDRPLAKLTDDLVFEIKRRRSLGEKAGDIAISLGVSQSTVSMVALGLRWKHVTTPEFPKPPRMKLTEIQARNILRRVIAGEKQADLAAEFSVCQQTVSDILHRRTWKSIR